MKAPFALAVLAALFLTSCSDSYDEKAQRADENRAYAAAVLEIEAFCERVN